jgi:hypothetical protein
MYRNPKKARQNNINIRAPELSAFTTNYNTSMTPTVDLPNGETKTNFVIRSNSDEYESTNSMETKEVVTIKQCKLGKSRFVNDRRLLATRSTVVAL